MKRASYREAIQWIVDNDDREGIRDPECVLISQALIADIFYVDYERVQRDCVRKLP